MIKLWWDAHEFEFVMSAIIIGIAFVVWVIANIIGAIAARRRTSKNIDAALAADNLLSDASLRMRRRGRR